MRSGNVQWMAPEILEPGRYNQSMRRVDIQAVPGTVTTARPTKEGDIYTFACLCIEVHDLFLAFHRPLTPDIQALHRRWALSRPQ